MKQQFISTSKTKHHINPISFAFFIAFGVIAIAVGYKALSTNADVRSRAAEECPTGTVKKTNGAKYICRERSKKKNGKTIKWTECGNEMTYYCAPTQLREAGSGAVNQPAQNGGGTLNAVDGSGH